MYFMDSKESIIWKLVESTNNHYRLKTRSSALIHRNREQVCSFHIWTTHFSNQTKNSDVPRSHCCRKRRSGPTSRTFTPSLYLSSRETGSISLKLKQGWGSGNGRHSDGGYLTSIGQGWQQGNRRIMFGVRQWWQRRGWVIASFQHFSPIIVLWFLWCVLSK